MTRTYSQTDGSCYLFQMLQDLGILGGVRRFAGTSAGSMVAALLAVGANSQELDEIVAGQNLGNLIYGVCKILYS